MRYLLTVFLLIWSNAWASFPATSTPGTPTYYWNGDSRAQKHTSFAAAWSAWQAANPSVHVCGNYSGQPYGGSCTTPEPSVNTSVGYTTFSFTQYSYNKSNGSYNGASTLTWYMEKQTALVCPANSTLSGSNCVCNAGFNESGSSCVAPPACPASGTSAGNVRYFLDPGEVHPDYFYDMADQPHPGCVTQTGTAVCTYVTPERRECRTDTKYTGDSYTGTGGTGGSPSTPATRPEPLPGDPVSGGTNGPCQAGYYYGTVNGTTVCVPGYGTEKVNAPTAVTTTKPDGSGTTVTTTGTTTNTTTNNGTPTVTTTWGVETMRWDVTQPSQNVGSPPAGATAPTAAGETKTTTVTNPDGSVTKHEVTKKEDGTYDVKSTNGTVEKTQNTTSCTGSTCTTETTKTENGQTTETTTGTGTKDGICKETPSNPVCGTGSEGMFGGTCDAGFICEGDAVQCAISKELHTRQCQLYSDKEGDATRYADAVSGADGKSAQALKDAAAAGASNIGVFNTSGYGWGRSCPADPQIPLTWVSGGELVIPFSRICGPLGLLAAGAVAMNLLGCMVFVVRT